MTEKGVVSFTGKAVEMAEGVGARVRRLFPTRIFPYLDPFVLLDEFFVEPPAGFPDHQHRGFEFITYMLKGAFKHRDNAGNEKIVPTGGIQRAVTGRGIIHSEMPAGAGTNQGLQLWINLPRRLKELEPEYEYVGPEDLPMKIEEKSSIRTIVGEGSPVEPHTPMVYLDVNLKEDGRFSEKILRTFNAFIYVLEGYLAIGDVTVGPHEGAVLKPGSQVIANATGPARLVYIAGNPYNEPIRLRGPFVE